MSVLKLLLGYLDFLGNNRLVGKKQHFSLTIPCFPGGSVVKTLPATAGDMGSIPGREGSLKKEMVTCLGNPMDRGAWRATVHGVAKSRTRLSDFAFRLQDLSFCFTFLA